jgi:hypothetical protein
MAEVNPECQWQGLYLGSTHHVADNGGEIDGPGRAKLPVHWGLHAAAHCIVWMGDSTMATRLVLQSV